TTRIWPAHLGLTRQLSHNNTALLTVCLPDDPVAGHQGGQIAALVAAQALALLWPVQCFYIQLLAIVADYQPLPAVRLVARTCIAVRRRLPGGMYAALLLPVDAPQLLLVKPSFGHGRAFSYNAFLFHQRRIAHV